MREAEENKEKKNTELLLVGNSNNVVIMDCYAKRKLKHIEQVLFVKWCVALRKGWADNEKEVSMLGTLNKQKEKGSKITFFFLFCLATQAQIMCTRVGIIRKRRRHA